MRGDHGEQGCSGRRTRVFVYGTLRAGEDNHHYLRGAPLLRRAFTGPTFDLVDLGAFPALVPGGATAVAGELYDLDDATLAALDELEDHPHFYRRAEIPLDDGTLAHTYVLAGREASCYPQIASGDWRRRG
jgi:gamma-glutamylcyclotransferase (GGCT)/AIG2-like uncharacterized protein YtfP